MNLEAKDRKGCRPIHIACKYKNADIIKLLVDKVDLNVLDDDETLPLHYAFLNEDLNIVKILVDGFVSDKIYATKSLTTISFIDEEIDDNIRKFISQKLEVLNKTLFTTLNKNYSDIEFN